MGMGRLLVRFVLPVCSSVWVLLSPVFQCGFSVPVKGSTESAFELCVIYLRWKVGGKGGVGVGFNLSLWSVDCIGVGRLPDIE